MAKWDDGRRWDDGTRYDAGQPFAAPVVDEVTTLDPGQPAALGVSFDESNVRFTFAIPRGVDWPPGSNATLATAIAGTSSNSNAVATLGQTADGAPGPPRSRTGSTRWMS